ncbi:hypothetical protein FRC05_009146 [Tulasnella sp. 425]|nr:hypothetical protein FRC05_009146 [Tulasnella sp. 425]
MGQGNLKDYLEMNLGLTRYDKLCLIFQTSCGLEHLHSQTPPICHADIKPENVLVNDRNGLALSDFGLSRVVQDLNARSGFTTSETVKGSVRYMAPELFAGKKSSLETDVYAFGGLILTVMSGKPPFDDLPHEVILYRVSSDEPPIPEDHPNLPAHDPLWKLMRRCWNYDPTARPTMQRVLREILECNAIPRELLLDTRATLENVKMSANLIPVIGKYIRTAAEVGLSLVDIVEVESIVLISSLYLGDERKQKSVSQPGVQSVKVGQSSSGFGGTIETASKCELEVAQRKLKKRYPSNLVRNESASSDDASREWCQGTAQKVLEEIQVLVALNTSSLIDEFENPELQEQNRHVLHRLGDGNYGAQGNAIEEVICLPGTRVEILDRIDNWIRDKSSSDRVFWIRGMAGRGKSTIASTVAHNWQSRASCAIFYFRRGHDTVNASIVCALARQLGSSLNPEVRKAILESVQENEDIAAQRLEVQFQTLIVVPLSRLVHQSRIILFIVDALDECQNPRDTVAFVKLIDRHFSSFPTNVKFLLTCRPEAPLLRSLEPRKWPVEDLDSSGNVANDLARFIKQGCSQIREDHDLPEDWPASSDIRKLVKMSQGLFQWAQTVITYIGNGSPVNRLRDLLSRPSTLDGLDELYHQILSKAFNTVMRDPARQELLCATLGTLVVAPYPVSLEIIATLYGDNSIFEGVDQQGVIQYLRRDILVDLNSLLLIPTSPTQSMHLMHTSIRDLLVDEQRCNERAYFIDVRHHHERLASLCLGIMLRCLKENICSLSDLSKPNSEVQDVIERELSTSIRYCSQAWSIHPIEGAEWSVVVTKGPDGPRADFETFSKEKLLYWLEVMSLIGATGEAIVIAKRVYSWLSETQLWRCYGRHAKIQTLRSVQHLTWAANLWTRSAGTYVVTIAFSPDGEVLASGSEEGTIQLWDAQTGTPLGQPLTGHSRRSLYVAFSPDGKVLASASKDGTIQLWEAQTGTPLGQPLTGHNCGSLYVAFSPDGKVLASGSEDGTIRLWDAQVGTPLGQSLTGHNGDVLCLAFSPDGKVLASGSIDGTIQLWDAEIWTPFGQPLTFQKWLSILSIAFSPDGKVLTSGLGDGTVHLWDVQTGTSLGQPLKCYNHDVCFIALSPDNKVLASASEEGTIQLWDAETRKPLGQPLTGHDYCSEEICLTAAFSPDGKFLASGSIDGTIRLWDAQNGGPSGQPLTGRNHNVYYTGIAFLPNGKVLASGSSDGTIQLWDAQTGTPLRQPVTGHQKNISSLASSPDGKVLASASPDDGKVLASGSNDGTIRLWDAQMGMPLSEPLTGRNHDVRSVAFLLEGRVLASGSEDGTTQLWDAKTGSPLGQLLTGPNHNVPSNAISLEGKVLAFRSWGGTIQLWDARIGAPLGQPITSDVCPIAFSPDGKILASALWGTYWGSMIQLWDAQTETPLGQPMRGAIRSIVFSPDSKVLAFQSWPGARTIELWDAQTASPLGQPLTGHDHDVQSVAFLPDSKVLASQSKSGTIQLWDAQTGTPLSQPLISHNRDARSVAFSLDNKLMASRSKDGTIQLWDAQTMTPLGQPLTGHNDEVRSLAFSPDGKVLASTCWGGRIQLWDTQTGISLSEAVTDSQGPLRPKYTIPDIHDHWVILSSSRLFWLPSQYWVANPDFPPTVLLHNGILAIESRGTLSIFNVSYALQL